MSDILNKPWKDMTLPELIINFYYWRDRVETAPGWSSAYEAAKNLKVTCYYLNGFGRTINPFPIRKG